MAALCAAPWYIVAPFCVFGGVLIACGLWWLLCWVADTWPGDLNDPHDYCAEDVRDPTKE